MKVDIKKYLKAMKGTICMNKVIVITGPTAVGKTKLSIELSKYYNGEVINADSTQIFKDLDIATAKITNKEKEDIIHHLIDIKNIEEEYTVFDYQKDSRKKIDYLFKNNKTPIMVGGTGLYIKAALYDYKFETEEQKFNYDNYTDLELYDEWIKINPNTNIHKNNRKRIERALSYYKINKEFLEDQIKTDELLYDVIFIGLTSPREILYEKINTRVDIMIKDGLLEEARKIYDTNIRSRAVMTPIGYKELFDYFDNKTSLEESINLIKQRSRNYAKKQYTWFNNQMDIKWFNTNYEDFNKTVEEIIKYINAN